MGQDTEEAAEFVATVRADHVAMKRWYHSDDDDSAVGIRKELRSQYGPYPSLWKEVLNWSGWKETRKAYLKYLSQQEKQQQREQHDREQQPQQQSQPLPPSASDGSRKRKSRWGTTSTSASTPAAPNPAPIINSSPPAALPLPILNLGTVGLGNANGIGGGQASHYATPSESGAAAAAAAAVAGAGGLLFSFPMSNSRVPEHKQEEMRQLQSRLREINDKIQKVDTEAARIDELPRGHADRSPSPPPIYGSDGKRQNTRAERWKKRYSTERQDLLEKLMNLNPVTRGQSGLLVRQKRTRKIHIPLDKHPNYNFIGLIIGPRGKTQKELEAKTGCKIAIRGKGSVKEGARGRRDGKFTDGDNDPLHVVITGDDQHAVDAASDMIEQMLIVIDDEKNVHKQQQLRELALLNGTLKEDEYCSVCGEKGHREFECPKRFALNKSSGAMQVRCAICGDTSHPTRDCTQRRPSAMQPNSNTQELDSDYMSFMAELDGKKTEQRLPQPVPANALPVVAGNGAAQSAATTNGNEIALPPPPTGMPPPPLGLPPPTLPPIVNPMLPPRSAMPPLPIEMVPPNTSAGDAGDKTIVSTLPPQPPLPLPPPFNMPPAIESGSGVQVRGLPPPLISSIPLSNGHYPNNIHNQYPPGRGAQQPYERHHQQQPHPSNHHQHQHQYHQKAPYTPTQYGSNNHNSYGRPPASAAGNYYSQQSHPLPTPNYTQHGQFSQPQQQLQQQQQQQQQQQPPVVQVRPGEETTAWDPNAYFGNDSGTAGGFNWWDEK